MHFFLAIVVLSTMARAEVNQSRSLQRFYGHLTTSASTIDQGKVSFEAFPGANGGTSFLINSLSIGVLDSLQVGVVPLFYLFVPNHRWNFNLKMNFLREENIQLGAGYSRFSIQLSDLEPLRELDGSITSKPFADLGFLFLALNFRRALSPIGFGINVAQELPTSNSPLIENFLLEKTRNHFDWAIDMSYDLNESLVLTPGLSELRTDIFEISSPRAFGYGVSLSIKNFREWLSRWTIGLNYQPSERRLGLLLNLEM